MFSRHGATLIEWHLRPAPINQVIAANQSATRISEMVGGIWSSTNPPIQFCLQISRHYFLTSTVMRSVIPVLVIWWKHAAITPLCVCLCVSAREAACDLLMRDKWHNWSFSHHLTNQKRVSVWAVYSRWSGLRAHFTEPLHTPTHTYKHTHSRRAESLLADVSSWDVITR